RGGGAVDGRGDGLLRRVAAGGAGGGPARPGGEPADARRDVPAVCARGADRDRRGAAGAGGVGGYGRGVSRDPHRGRKTTAKTRRARKTRGGTGREPRRHEAKEGHEENYSIHALML